MFTSTRIILATSAAGLALVAACSSSTKTGTPAGAGGGSSSTSSATVSISSTGGTLVGPNGHTLYENTVDTTAKISCTGACATAWPPVTGSPSVNSGLDASKFATVSRPDGTVQATYNGHPLYTFASDTAAGDKKGEGIADGGGSWHVASVAGSSTPANTTPAPGSTQSSSSGGYKY